MSRVVRFVACLTPLCVAVLGIYFARLSPASAQTPAQSAAAAYFWIEGESFADANAKPNLAGWGRKEFLSSEKWLHYSVDANKTAAEVPGEGAMFRYDFETKAAGEWHYWNRIGYEFVRSRFEWRVDDGGWQIVEPDALTTDLMALENWNEVAWYKMGAGRLSAGKHTLTIRVPKTKNEKGEPAKVLYASDALCFTTNPNWRPDGPRRPDAPATNEATPTPFAIPTQVISDGSPRARVFSVKLLGTWEIARDDEQRPGATETAMSAPPSDLHWKSIRVPGDKNVLRPDLLMAHRLWYRVRVTVPKTAGASFHMVFPQNNLNTTLYVNGKLCGFDKNPFARMQFDCTDAIKNGENEIVVGIRDAWYAYSANPNDPMKLRRIFNLPVDWLKQGFQDLAYPIWGHPESGILSAPTLSMTGTVYAADVFMKPSVASKRLDAEITLRNPTNAARSVSVRCEAIDAKTKEITRTFPIRSVSVPANGTANIEIGGSWENAKLWWPEPEAQMYTLRTTITPNDPAKEFFGDTHDQPFGFREWGQRGKDFTLNGIVWHGWASLDEEPSADKFREWYRASGQRFMRFWGTEWKTLRPHEALDYYDVHGIVCRRSGLLDGQAIGYNAIENDPVLKERYKSDIKMDLMNNWRDQMVAQVKGERNHPSVMLWSLENEWLYINCINLYGDKMDLFEAEVQKVSDAVREADPTRLNMTDGGGAAKANTLPVHGDHYVFSGTSSPGAYPDLAYQANPDGGGRGRWRWDQKRPRFIGEDFFANGVNPADYAFIGGETTFQGKAQSRDAAARIARMLTEGYRWAGYGAWHFWFGPSSVTTPAAYKSNADVAVFVRQYDSTFLSGQEITRTLGIFNDGISNLPITLEQTLRLSQGKGIAPRSVSATINPFRTKIERIVAPGENAKFDVRLPMPVVTTRTTLVYSLTLTQNGKTVFTDTKNYTILPPVTAASFPKFGATGQGAGNPYLYDPNGETAKFLAARVVKFSRLNSLENLPQSGKLLIIGRDALTSSESQSSRLAAWASGGNGERRVVVLEQTNPLQYQGLPTVEMEPDENSGRFAFAEDLNHPILRGLQQSDFFAWAGADGLTYRNAYRKPTRGARSLVQCDVRLQNSALAEIPVGGGLIVVCQMPVAAKLTQSATAQRLLANMLAYAVNYQQVVRQTVVVAAQGSQLAKALDAVGLRYGMIPSVNTLWAMSAPRLAIIEATPENLRKLVASLPNVRAFTKTGGWLFLHGLTPEGLASYNKIVGFDHMIRPFRRERVAFAPVRHPLTAGLTLGDIVMVGGEKINNFTDDRYVANDIYSHIVDYDDVAPFAKLPDDYSYNTVNGFVSADAWQLIYSFDLNNKKPPVMPYVLPKAQEITEIEWIGNAFYHLVTKIELDFDGKKATFATKPNNEPQTFALPPGNVGKTITLTIAEWAKVSTGANVVGMDNVRLKAKRPAAFYKRVHPLVNVGGLMQYDDPTSAPNAGGIVLCNLLLKEREDVPENAAKKRRILATLLANLKAPMGGGKLVIAGGANLKYASVDLAGKANQYVNERGWFGDKNGTFADLPSGRQVFAGVPFQTYNFATSPVPTVVMLGGPNVPNNLPDAVRGIAINQKADALFFLHTARLDRRRNDSEKREKKRFELARYVVTYADGQSVDVPVYAEENIGDFKAKTADVRALPGAQIGWTKPYAQSGESAVAYVMQWNNPRPGVVVKSMDLVYGKDKGRGIPALLAITAASAK